MYLDFPFVHKTCRFLFFLNTNLSLIDCKIAFKLIETHKSNKTKTYHIVAFVSFHSVLGNLVKLLIKEAP